MKKYLALAAMILCIPLLVTSCGTIDMPPYTVHMNSYSHDFRGVMPERTLCLLRQAKKSEKERTAMKMNVQIGAYTFTAALEKNNAVQELAEMMRQGPVTIAMDDYAGFEKVGPLGRSLTTSNSQTTTAAGDIVLYNGNNIVMFYGSNSWSYTRIGKIDDLTNWNKALGSGSISAILTLAE